MTQFTLRAINIDNTSIKQREINESHRHAQEFDPDSSDENDSILLQERYSMNR